ncbi:mitochondrial carrier [Dichomitus squalens]|uniref:Mitochondrial carrier n=1 Tax=Dichomitus squalens TaxID=114155 RepID=A0A4Q9NSB3_9APHY|nr:mitochondrial carrier [Dichomitus squalens]TBU44514.1 mitochondrial carrier [Dichomitus squalens]TBU54646.1 mitochondrial carrier [Dichomitus squalens]
MPSKSANSMIAGAGGGLVASVATCPLDVIKTKLQAQRAVHGHEAYQGVVATVKSILQHDGFRGLYRGLGPTILGYLPTWAIYFAVYDGIKRHFGERPSNEVDGARRLYPAAQVKGYQPLAREHPWTLHILSAMTAGATSTICTNPLWVIKTRFMTQPREEGRYRHTLDAALTIYRTEGWRAFFRGLLPSLLGITHVAVQFPLYEHLKRVAGRERHEPLTVSQILGCSAVAKMTASIVTYPHEVVRTRFQTEKRPLSENGDSRERGRRGLVRTTIHIVKQEGWRALYRGLSVNLVRTVPNSAVTMLTYEMLVRYLNHRSGFS